MCAGVVILSFWLVALGVWLFGMPRMLLAEGLHGVCSHILKTYASPKDLRRMRSRCHIGRLLYSMIEAWSVEVKAEVNEETG